MKHDERAVMFECGGERLLGILAEPAQPHPVGVLIVVGGSQYRVGSHRQFTLLARHLAARGHAVFRFDQRGLGDSTGQSRPVEEIDQELPELVDDIRRAVDTFVANSTSTRRVVVWGICGAASAAMVYGPQDPRIAGLVLLNPWARGARTYARTQLRHYYLSRLVSKSLWKKLLSAQIRLGDSFRSAANAINMAARRSSEASDFRDQMLRGIEAFSGPMLLVLSGRDLTAREFDEYTKTIPRWRSVLTSGRLERVDIAGADHTFSSQAWREEVAHATSKFVDRIGRSSQGAPVVIGEGGRATEGPPARSAPPDLVQ